MTGEIGVLDSFVQECKRLFDDAQTRYLASKPQRELGNNNETGARFGTGTGAGAESGAGDETGKRDYAAYQLKSLQYKMYQKKQQRAAAKRT